MQRIRFKSIFARLLFMQCVIVIAVLLVVGFVMAIVVRESNVRVKREILLEKAGQLQTTFGADGAGLESGVIRGIAREQDLLIQTYAGGTLSSYYDDEKWAFFAAQEARNTAFLNVSRNAKFSPSHTTNYFKANKPFAVLTLYFELGSGTDTTLILMHYDLTPATQATNTVIIWIVCISALALLCTIMASYVTASRIINPFVRMNHTVQCYTKGDFSQRIHVTGKDEAAQLGKTFNEMAEQLRNLEETRRSFVANVSHELRSPLTSMNGFLEAMHDGVIPCEEHEHYIGLVLSETRRMTGMVNDLLDLARIESGTVRLNYELFDINELIRRVLITFETRIMEKNLEVDIRFAQEQSFVYADSAQISQVLRNLIDNAIKYSPENKGIGIATYGLRKEAFVSIRDNGLGIPQEDVPHVFDRFYKVEKAHTPTPAVGSGLGLSIVKRIIEEHEQTITVRSAKGRGTQFTFSLQRAIPSKRQR
ncbi:MAG: ATP-binding protein [Clostridiales bacterium]|nr:ATP-binding protein [Clostridiales bacterium]